MLKQNLKYFAYFIAGLIGLAVILAAYLAATFNPNDYKPLIVKMVKEKKQRNISINGDIKLSFWPKIGADLGQISLSEHASETEFASIKSAKVALAVLPLLKKELVVDTIYIDGAHANVIKDKAGHFNFEDLMSKDEGESEQIKFDVQGVNINHTSASYIDETTGAKYNVSELNLTTGHVALATPFDLDGSFNVVANQPAANAKVKLKGNVMVDPESQHITVKGLDGEVVGALLGGENVSITASGKVDVNTKTAELDVGQLKLTLGGDFNGANNQVTLNAPALKISQAEVRSEKISLQVKQKKGDADLSLNLDLADMKGNQKAVKSSGITADISSKQGARSVSGHFSSPFQANLETLVFDIPKLAGSVNIKDPAMPNGAMTGQFNLSAHADVKQQQVKSNFNLTLAETKLNGDVAVKGFATPRLEFNLNADKINLNHLLGKSENTGSASASSGKSTNAKPADLTALSKLFLDGHVNIGQITYAPYQVTGLNVGIKADGSQLALQGLNVKVDHSTIKGSLGVSQFSKPLYHFNLDIDQLDLNKYMPATAETSVKDSGVSNKANKADQAIDLSALKALNAEGSIRVGQLTYGKTQANNVNIGLKAQDGVANLAPLNANLYKGSMQGSLKVDARATPSIAIQQNLKGISIGPLLVDTINNDMLTGTGSLNLDVTTQGATVAALKKALSGSASMNLADGAVKGFDIAGSFRDFKSKINVLKSKDAVAADQNKKTDFSELTASFAIKNGVAHNDDLAMKAPIFRLGKGDSKGDIDIGNETINYVAKPTLVNSLKGQGGKEVDQLDGVAIPIKISGTFSKPSFGMDFAAVGLALAKSSAIDKLTAGKLAPEQAGAVKDLLSGGNKVDALKGLLKGKKDETAPTNADVNNGTEAPASPTENLKEQALKKLLKF